jgi:hypothetical protein
MEKANDVAPKTWSDSDDEGNNFAGPFFVVQEIR